jgi:hypothetical protein
MATNIKRKRPANKALVAPKKNAKIPPKHVVEEEEDIDIDEIIAAEERAGGMTLEDLAASSDEEQGDTPQQNKYFKNVDDDDRFIDDEELEAYIEGKKRGLLRPSINNTKQLQIKLTEITDNAPWPETLAISAEEDLDCPDIIIFLLSLLFLLTLHCDPYLNSHTPSNSLTILCSPLNTLSPLIPIPPPPNHL